MCHALLAWPSWAPDPRQTRPWVDPARSRCARGAQAGGLGGREANPMLPRGGVFNAHPREARGGADGGLTASWSRWSVPGGAPSGPVQRDQRRGLRANPERDPYPGRGPWGVRPSMSIRPLWVGQPPYWRGRGSSLGASRSGVWQRDRQPLQTRTEQDRPQSRDFGVPGAEVPVFTA